jgi:hypothetical protein
VTADDDDDIIITDMSGNIKKYWYFPVEIKHPEIEGSEYSAGYSYLQLVD